MDDLYSSDEQQMNEQPKNQHWSQRIITLYKQGQSTDAEGDNQHNFKIRGFVNGDSLLKMTMVVNFAAEFALTVENVWISALLMQYNMNPTVDSFIWVIPNILAIICKPIIETYVQCFDVTIFKYIDQIVVNLTLAAIGHYIVTTSTFVQLTYDLSSFPFSPRVLRILLATIGWILIDFNLEMALTSNDNVRAYLIQHQIKTIQQDRIRKQDESISLAAKLSCYLLTLLLCRPPYTFRNFHLQLVNMYYVSGLLCLNVAFFVVVTNKVRISKGIEKVQEQDENSKEMLQKTLKSINFRLDTYFCGCYETIRAPIKLQLILLIIFCYNCVIDITQVYATCWMILNRHSLTLPFAGIYISGISTGCLFLWFSSLITYITKRKTRQRDRYLEQMDESRSGYDSDHIRFGVRYLICILCNLLATLYAACTSHMVSLWVVILLNGWLLGNSEIYIERKEDILSKYYPQFQKCQDFVLTFENLFFLLIMPVYCQKLQGQRAMEGGLWTSVVLLLLMLLAKSNELVKTQKERENNLHKKAV